MSACGAAQFRRQGMLFGLLYALSVAPAAAQWKLFDFDFDDASKSWKEIESRLPPAPKPSGLIRFEGGGGSPHVFLIDADSVSVGEDGVVRYTLVIRTSGGATNVSFEGIRCQTGEQKLYAIGRADGSWARARDPQWRTIQFQEVNRHHIVLQTEIFCDGRQPVRNAKEALDRLRYGSSRN